MDPSNQTIKIVDDPSVTPIFINKAIMVQMDINGTILLTLGDTRHVPQHGVQPGITAQIPDAHVTVRLAISQIGAIEIVQALTKPLEYLKARAEGKALDPFHVPPGSPKN